MRRIARIALALASVALAVVVTACGGSSGGSSGGGGGASAGGGEIVIGEIIDRTGPNKDFNDAANPGYDVGFRAINDAGGIHGAKIKVIKADAASDPARTPIVVRKLAQQGAVMIVGPYSSNAAIAAAPLAAQLKLPILFPTSSADWPEEFNDYSFRLTPALSRVLPAYARSLLEQLGAKRLGIVYDKANDASVTEVAQIERALPSGVEIVGGKQSFQTGDVDFTAQISSLLSARPDVIWIGGLATESSLLMRQLRQRGYEGVFAAGSTLNNPALYEQSGGAARGLLTFQPAANFDPLGDDPTVVAIRDALGRPPTGSMLQAYSATQVVADALRRAKDPRDRDAVREALGATNGLETVMGPVTWHGKGDNDNTFFTTLELTEDGFVPWKP